jgi:hypothetical protein
VEHTCAGILKSVFVLNIVLLTSLMTRVKVFWLLVEFLCLIKHLVVSNCFLFEKIGGIRAKKGFWISIRVTCEHHGAGSDFGDVRFQRSRVNEDWFRTHSVQVHSLEIHGTLNWANYGVWSFGGVHLCQALIFLLEK